MGAASTANGLGLCKPYAKLDVCDVEDAQMPIQRVLAIEYTREAVMATMSPFQASRKAFHWNLDRAWDLGADAIPVEKTEEME